MLVPGGGPATLDVLSGIGFVDVAAASERFQRLAGGERERQSLAELLPAVLLGLESAHTPDQALLNFERFVNAIPDRQQLFTALATSPRQVEILLRLFVSSQFLTEILIRHPESLDRLAHHQRLAEIKSLPQMLRDAEQSHASADSPPAQLAALQQFQQREILRLAACDTFHLMDLRTITQQLSRLADAVVQSCLTIVARNLGVDAGDFAVLAFGKLGAEELNYSSDIDLVFVARRDAERQWKLGQRLIAALSDAAGGGFLYRVDMRLRPWGKSGPLVTTIDAYLDYLHRQARPWELQALLKARAIAGEMAIGETFLESAEPLVFSLPDDVARRSIRDMLDAIIPEGASPATALAEVKTGPGGIREIEFLTQYLQLLYGRELPAVRKRSTLEALTQLADAELILPGEFQHLSSAYIFQRSVEHSL
ncbi:MAG: glutamine synthetase adenylyltransferase, partial [Planctomycetaceae bacterium]|nr:glutamine synthetase adenylyltransferase [Planctomycetaceae bacterium]